MKTKATNLTPKQIELAWNTAVVVEGQDLRSIREDFLGAIIHRKDYDVNSKYGWCVEYILSPQLLEHHCGCSVEDAFCEENIRVLFIGNHEANKNECIGHYATRYRANNERQNRYQLVWQNSDISEYGMFVLKKKFHLSDEIMRTIFPEYKECNDK